MFLVNYKREKSVSLYLLLVLPFVGYHLTLLISSIYLAADELARLGGLLGVESCHHVWTIIFFFITRVLSVLVELFNELSPVISIHWHLLRLQCLEINSTEEVVGLEGFIVWSVPLLFRTKPFPRVDLQEDIDELGCYRV